MMQADIDKAEAEKKEAEAEKKEAEADLAAVRDVALDAVRVMASEGQMDRLDRVIDQMDQLRRASAISGPTYISPYLVFGAIVGAFALLSHEHDKRSAQRYGTQLQEIRSAQRYDYEYEKRLWIRSSPRLFPSLRSLWLGSWV
jgi:hypothetical protein